MIPNPVCSLWVAFSIMSIEAGVIGFMTWWNVNLDGIALINLIMCIGFSVDFSAHICYHYMSEEGKAPEERIAASLYALGLPIIQGAVSTILGVVGLAFASSYLYFTFFKMIFLVIFLGALHGLILLPVLLSLFGPNSCSPRGEDADSVSTSSPTAGSLVVSSRLRQQSCYTLNLSLADTLSKQREDSLPHCLPSAPTAVVTADHFQRRSPSWVGEYRCSDTDQDRFGSFYTTGGAEDSYVSTLVIAPSSSGGVGVGGRGPSDPRLTPVPESEEQYDSIVAQLGMRQQQHQQRRNLSRQNSRAPPPAPPSTTANNNNNNNSGLAGMQGTTLPLGDHKKIGRAKSHMPRTQTMTPVSDKQLLKELKPKQPLRKYHSFPYHMFKNETTGYSSSSDESVKSATFDDGP
jgi:hypothetical protein